MLPGAQPQGGSAWMASPCTHTSRQRDASQPGQAAARSECTHRFVGPTVSSVCLRLAIRTLCDAV